MRVRYNMLHMQKLTQREWVCKIIACYALNNLHPVNYNRIPASYFIYGFAILIPSDQPCVTSYVDLTIKIFMKFLLDVHTIFHLVRPVPVRERYNLYMLALIFMLNANKISDDARNKSD